MSDSSKEILHAYLCKELYQLITKAQFQGLMNKVTHRTVEKQTVSELYRYFTDYLDDTVNTPVSQRINALQLTGVYEEDRTGFNEQELSKLIDSLASLQRSIDQETEKVNESCDAELAKIDSISAQLEAIETGLDTQNYGELKQLDDQLKSIEEKLVSS